MKIAILGAGAIGSCVGGFMARDGHHVHLLGRPAHMDAIREHGLKITGIWGDHQVAKLACHTNIDTMPRGDYDLVLITVKSYDTAHAAALAQQIAGDTTLVCAYQNGLGNADQLLPLFGPERTLAARAIYGVRSDAPGEIEVTVIAQPTALGLFRPAQGAPSASCVRAIAKAMETAGLPTVFTEDIEPILWAKVAYNSALNPLSALLDVPYGRLAEMDETRGIMDRVIHELYAVGQANEIRLNPAQPDEYLDLFYNKLIPPTAAHYASMREDLRLGRRTEIDALNGAILQYGKPLEIVCAANQFLVDLIKAREQSASS